jgi:hypothetical protein
VDLITRNLPVPGIEEIPTTVLEPGSSKVDRTPRRKKPWEKDEQETTTEEVEEEADTTDQATRQPSDNAGPEPAAAAGEPTDGPPTETTNPRIDVNGHKETGQGVVNILRPGAVPDGGLLAKD